MSTVCSHSKYLLLDKGKSPNLFILTQIANAMVILLRCVTSQKGEKRDSSPLALEREVDLEGQQQILDKEASNHHLPQIQPSPIIKATKFLHV